MLWWKFIHRLNFICSLSVVNMPKEKGKQLENLNQG